MFVVKVGKLVALVTEGRPNEIHLVNGAGVCFAAVGNALLSELMQAVGTSKSVYEESVHYFSLADLIAVDRTPAVVMRLGKTVITIDSNIKDNFFHIRESKSTPESTSMETPFLSHDGSYSVFGVLIETKDEVDMAKLSFVIGDIPIDKRHAVRNFLSSVEETDFCDDTNLIEDFIVKMSNIIYGEHREQEITFRSANLSDPVKKKPLIERIDASSPEEAIRLAKLSGVLAPVVWPASHGKFPFCYLDDYIL